MKILTVCETAVGARIALKVFSALLMMYSDLTRVLKYGALSHPPLGHTYNGDVMAVRSFILASTMELDFVALKTKKRKKKQSKT